MSGPIWYLVMDQAERLSKIEEVMQPVLQSHGLDLVDLDWRREGRRFVLRLFVDKPGGASIDDCVRLSREAGDVLEVSGLIPESYDLEVSSPGLDRKLTKAADFQRFTGSRMKLMTRQPVNNNRYFEGRLESFREGLLTLDLSVASKKSRKKMGAAAAEQGQKIGIDFANVEKANLVPEI